MINQDNTPIKYLMNVWKSLPNYPTKLDVLYEICTFLTKSEKTEFSEQTLNGLWCDSKGVASWRGTKLEDGYNKLMEEGFFKLNKSVNGKDWYQINEEKNPFA